MHYRQRSTRFLFFLGLISASFALHAQSARDAATHTRGRVTSMVVSNVTFSGNYSYTYTYGGSCTLKTDTVTNSGGTATGPLRLALWFTTGAFGTQPAYLGAGPQFTSSLAAGASMSAVQVSAPFVQPPTGCYTVTFDLEELVGATWTVRDSAGFTKSADSNGGCISSFTATPPTIASGGTSTLAWTTAGTTTGVTIDNSVGAQAANGSVPVHPTATTTYALSTVNTVPAGMKNVTVTVTTPPPMVSNINPNHGPAAGGNTVNLTGTNLTNATVSFGGTAGVNPVSSATTVAVVAPAHAAGSVTVTVTTSGGSTSTTYTYDAPAALPTITSITPSHGPIAGGTHVTIAGTNLGGATSVVFGTTNGGITANTATSISVTAPPHAAGGVLVNVMTPGGSATARYDYDAPATVDTTQLLPVVGSAPGNFGSFFRTSLQLHNPSTSTTGGKLVFHPQGQTPSSGDPSTAYSLAPGETKFYNDILPAMNASGLGTLDLQPNSGTPAPLSLVRVFNDGGSAGTTGMNIDFVPAGSVLTQGDTGVLLAPPTTTGFRFNIGIRALANGVTMAITVRDASGATTRTLTQSYGANTFTQVDASAVTGGALNANDSVAFTINSGSALIYGSTTDNTTQDPSYQGTKRVPILSSSTAVIPVVGSLPGNFGSFFRTAVQMHNPLSTPVRVRAVFHNQGTNGSDSDPSLPITLAPGETKYYADILTAFNLAGLGSIDIVPLDGSIPLIVSRIYNDACAKGTTGMTLGAILPADALSAGESAVLVAPPNAADFRYNIGIRTLGDGASVQYTVRDATGAVKKTTAATYGANYFAQLKASDVVGTDIAANDSITISVNGGALIVYGATTDNRTQDPAAQLAAPM
jgi:hypothetical protein